MATDEETLKICSACKGIITTSKYKWNGTFYHLTREECVKQARQEERERIIKEIEKINLDEKDIHIYANAWILLKKQIRGEK